MNIIEKQNDTLVVRFRYDPAIVVAMRSLPARSWNKELKQWEVPFQYVFDVVRTLQEFDFQVEESVIAEAKKENEFKQSVTFEGFKTNLPLFPYQKAGVEFLLKAGSGILADEPGLGKSLQALAMCEYLQAQKILVLCPASLKFNWLSECEKWLPVPQVKVQVINGTPAERKEQWKNPSINFFIANYDLLLKDFDAMNSHNWDVIISDESTAICNPRAKRTKVIKKLKAKYKFALSGTPISNKLHDLWSIVDFVRPGTWGSYYQFENRYCIKDFWGSVKGYKNTDELKQSLTNFMIRRRKDDVLPDLPPKLVTEVKFELSGPERELYDKMKKALKTELFGKIDEEKVFNIENAMIKVLRLKQMVDHPRLVGSTLPSRKLETLKDILRPIIESGNKVIVFSQFAQMCKLLMFELSEHNPVTIIGEMKAEDRNASVRKFTESPNCQLMICSEAGAYGLNLQVANYVIHVDLPWSVSKLVQREGRAHRIGTQKPVTVYSLIGAKTVDEYVARVLLKKQKLSDEFLEDSRVVTVDDIKEILEDE